MTEQEYIDVKELTIVRDVIRLLSDITPEISDVINLPRYDTIQKWLHNWEQKLAQKIKTTE